MDNGWISIRNVPVPSGDETTRQSERLFQILKKFFDKFKVCPRCKGEGFRSRKKTRNVITTNVKFRGIEDLESIHENPDSPVKISDVIREIISFDVEGRLPCKKCRGMKYIKKSRK